MGIDRSLWNIYESLVKNLQKILKELFKLTKKLNTKTCEIIILINYIFVLIQLYLNRDNRLIMISVCLE